MDQLERGSRPQGRSDGSRPRCLLDLDGRTGVFELLLDLRGLVLVDPFLDRLGRALGGSFASLRPRPVIARTSLITLIFFSPPPGGSQYHEENSVFSAAASAAEVPPPPPATAATATGAAADTPHFSSSSFDSSAASRTVRLESHRPIFDKISHGVSTSGMEKNTSLSTTRAYPRLARRQPNTRASCAPGACRTPAILVAGVWSMPRILPRS